jgi:hypothetical protein
MLCSLMVPWGGEGFLSTAARLMAFTRILPQNVARWAEVPHHQKRLNFLLALIFDFMNVIIFQ